ncbi:Cytochrome c oxidase assembly protein COX16 like protein, mitochondrial [Myotis davidii]|uniref:Cytochrome c oxidase assembly protein COX16 homolog, mitochondrial n=1 Tax=Myotis davidii TaxID=225400 RepID=L5M1L0_MYODS|nr:Cytochrome c oxidase assembly protein COX16 like protein, mitochondrial [Myotis davidii]
MFTHAVTRALRKNKTLRYGVPMLVEGVKMVKVRNEQEEAEGELLVVGGSFGLREFSQIRYDAVKIKIDPELEKKLKMNQVSLESEYEKIKDSAFDDWKNIRGPRPWEDPELLQGRNPEILKTKTA